MKPLTLHHPEEEMVRALWMGNLAVFCLLLGGAFALAPLQSAVSVGVGGAIAMLNFRLMQRGITRALSPRRSGQGSILAGALLKYYLRFIATAVVIILLVRQGLVEPLGLLAGLSVVVVSIFIWGALQARKLYKEAD